MEILSPKEACKDFYNILKQVNENHQPVIIKGTTKEGNAVIISQDDWNSIQETLLLEQTEVMNKVRERQEDDSGFTDVDDIDWNKL